MKGISDASGAQVRVSDRTDSKVIEGSVYSPVYVNGSPEATAKALELVQKTVARLVFVEYFIFFAGQAFVAGGA